MAKRAPSAYFVFCDEERDSARQACSEADPSVKVSVATVAKELGKRWEALSSDQRQPYKDRAKQLAETAQENSQDCAQTGPAAQPPRAAAHGFAVSLVRRIMCQDAEVSRVSADAVRVVAKVSELMIEHLATKAHAAARSSKRSTIKFADVERAVSRDHRYVDMGLKDILAFEDTFAHARGEDKPAGGVTVCGNEPKSRQITAFFTA